MRAHGVLADAARPSRVCLAVDLDLGEADGAAADHPVHDVDDLQLEEVVWYSQDPEAAQVINPKP